MGQHQETCSVSIQGKIWIINNCCYDFSVQLFSSSDTNHSRAQPIPSFIIVALFHVSKVKIIHPRLFCAIPMCVSFLGSVLLRWACPSCKVTGQLLWHNQGITRFSNGVGFLCDSLVLFGHQNNFDFCSQIFSRRENYHTGFAASLTMQTADPVCFLNLRLQLFSLRESDGQWIPGLLVFELSNRGPSEEFQKTTSLIDSPLK